MSKITAEKLKSILASHVKWIQGEPEGERANLYGANLYGANLYGANLYGANLYGAKYSEGTKWPSPTMVLLASWGLVSTGLCTELMRYDAFCHRDPKKFSAWAKGGECPYRDENYQRACNFQEVGKHYQAGKPKNVHALMQMLLSEKCKKVKVKP